MFDENRIFRYFQRTFLNIINYKKGNSNFTEEEAAGLQQVTPDPQYRVGPHPPSSPGAQRGPAMSDREGTGADPRGEHPTSNPPGLQGQEKHMKGDGGAVMSAHSP